MKDKSGFTLIELMVTLIILVIITAGVTVLLINANNTLISSQNRNITSSAISTVQILMSKDLTLAGRGVNLDVGQSIANATTFVPVQTTGGIIRFKTACVYYDSSNPYNTSYKIGTDPNNPVYDVSCTASDLTPRKEIEYSLENNPDGSKSLHRIVTFYRQDWTIVVGNPIDNTVTPKNVNVISVVPTCYNYCSDSTCSSIVDPPHTVSCSINNTNPVDLSKNVQSIQISITLEANTGVSPSLRGSQTGTFQVTPIFLVRGN
ncbi:prepilin-type N-terminal cleavage/methylation domain-containing protein [Thermodesulfobium acidiphilum]|uniref:Prepilin-type N-terminal cleavage/methylation domain-containing protein n=1 Tax=Thermodesulfobium acidiphilum TaxID=1794699 RepID=A0A2R4W204_THEAF|nr:prepilin-type N-terminal cleavage/methylation domain-containing protein [Thermodesulfobium acidiphilum]AWB10722.1 prepilin-type N-terminal cleavage/methylation domain-containing protein [Thermodesulfobium acidiphilum]